MMYTAGVNCFLTKKEAVTHFKTANKIASKKYKKIMNGLNLLNNTVGEFSYNYFVHGDTYGIVSEGLYISFEVNGYDFRFLQ